MDIFPLNKFIRIRRAPPTELLLDAFPFLVFIFFWFCRSGDPPLLDETDFVKPLVNWIHFGPQPEGLFHTPYYPWLLMFLGRISHSLMLARSFNALCLMMTAHLAKTLLSQVIPSLTPLALRVFTLSILLCPVFLSSALTLDYDTSILMLTTAYFVVHLFKISTLKKNNFLWKQGLLFGACLVSKETTPFLYLSGIFFIFLKRERKTEKALLSTLWITFTGIFFFLITTGLWCLCFKIPFSQMFLSDLTALQAHGMDSKHYEFSRQLWLWITPLFWLSLPISGLCAFAFFSKKGIFKLKIPYALEVQGIAVIVSTGIFAYTFILAQQTFHFPKYMAPFFPWLFWLVFLWMKPKFEIKILNLILLILACTTFFIYTPNPLNILYFRNFPGLLDFIFWSLVFFIGFYAIPHPYLYKKEPPWPEKLFLLGLLFSIPHLLQIAFNEKSVTYFYGENAMPLALRMGKLWSEKNKTGVIISPAKDIAFNLRPFRSGYLPRDLLGRIPWAVCDEKNIPILIITRTREDSSLMNAPELADIQRCLRDVKVFGDIVLGSNRPL